MIKASNILLLANTKIRSRRIITIVSVLIASLLFSGLIAAGLLFFGLNKNINNLMKLTDSDGFAVLAVSSGGEDSFPLATNTKDIDALRDFEIAYKQGMQQKYRNLGVEFKDDIQPALIPDTTITDLTIPQKYRVKINYNSPVVGAYIDMKTNEYNKVSRTKASDFEILAKNSKAKSLTSIYDLKNLMQNFSLIENGREVQNQFGTVGFGDYFKKSIELSSYAVFNGDAVNRFVFDESQDLQGIPVIVSAEELQSKFGKNLGIPEPPKSRVEKIKWIQDVQNKAKNFTYEVCYRNSADLQIRDKFNQDSIEIEANKNDKDYIAPSLIYGAPKTVCGEYVVIKDGRTSDEKATDKKAEDDAKKLGEYISPARGIIKFQVVGVISSDVLNGDNDSSLSGFANSLFGIQDYLQYGGIILGDRISEVSNSSVEIFKSAQNHLSVGVNVENYEQYYSGYILEYGDAVSAKSVIDNSKKCQDVSRESAECAVLGNVEFTEFGRKFTLMNEFVDLFKRSIIMSAAIVIIVAVIIVWFIVGKIISESRRETAIYRAIGASRLTIFMIYQMYVFMLAFLISIFAVILGVLVSVVIANIYGFDLYLDIYKIFSVVDYKLGFWDMLEFNPIFITGVVLVILVSNVLAAFPLILMNIRRLPVDDIRE